MMGCTSKRLDPDLTGREAQRLEADLRHRVVGQDEAIQQVIQVYQTNLAGMSSPGRPIANLLFLGPTGSGKTRLVEALAESIVGSAKAVLKIDCGEFQHSHEIAKLIGSPPGYLGHRETHALLTQEALNQYHTDKLRISFLLFDEIEKASDALWHLLLGVLDRATLTLGDNRRVDFSQTLIFMTSNLGVPEMNSMMSPRVGFTVCDNGPNHAGCVPDQKLSDKIARAGIEAAKRRFSPEFMNRLDKTVVFRTLGMSELRDILAIELGAVQERIFNAPNLPPFVITVTNPAREYVLQEGTDVKYGARHLKRAIDRLLVHPLSNLIATGQASGNDVIRVDFDGSPGRLTFFKEASRANAVVASRGAIPAGDLATGALGTRATTEPMGWIKVRSTKR
jgi:ATP-dependent Clp protease ATP-binding subunit ClpA